MRSSSSSKYEPLLVHGEALHQVLREARCRPLPELRAAVAADAEADGEDRVEVVVLDLARNLALSLPSRFPVGENGTGFYACIGISTEADSWARSLLGRQQPRRPSRVSLHAFQKKSHRGIATDQRDIDLVKKRLSDAEQIDREKRRVPGRKTP
jgi:hypothetical protein